MADDNQANHDREMLVKMTRFEEQLKTLTKAVNRVEAKMATKDELVLVRNIVFGLIALIVTAVITGWLGQLIP